MNKLYIVQYAANEYDDLGYNSPYPIFYSLDKKKARNFFEDKIENEIEFFNEYMLKHPDLDHNEYYQITINNDNNFEYSMGNWHYEYQFIEVELDKNLQSYN